MATISFPRQLSRLVDEQTRIQREADNLATLMLDLCTEYPALMPAIYDGNQQISPFIGIFIDGQQVSTQQPASLPLSAASRVQLITAVAGG